MIRDFWVKNYLSISEKQELSFVTKGPDSEFVVEMPDGTFLNKLGLIYGPNASGKSNMLWAIDAIFTLLYCSNKKSSRKVRRFYPFALTKVQPIELHVSFYADSIRYDYDIEYTEFVILKEELYYYPNGAKALFYERTYIGEDVQADIKFGSTVTIFSKSQETIRENTLNNHSVLSTCSKISLKEDGEQLFSLYRWVGKYFHSVDGDGDNNGLITELKKVYFDEKKRNFYNLMLKKADLNLHGFKPVLVDRVVPSGLREEVEHSDIPDEVKEKILATTKDSIVFVNGSDSGSFEIPIELQSKGTMRYLRILQPLYDLITSNHVYYLDELGEDLHCDLLYYYLNVFLYNSDKSQLIITSQETALLAQDLLNEHRSAVWFVEKNKETASSEYARGDSFGLHKNLSLYNSYRIGRLGAKPKIGSFFIDLN